MRLLLLYILISSLLACNTTKTVVLDESYFEESLLDTLVVSAPAVKKTQSNSLPVYNPSYDRTHDLIHTKLELSFDWEKEYVLGKAELTLSPVFYESDVLELDAVGFDIHSIKNGKGKDLEFGYDDRIITINLDKSYTREEQYIIEIDYTGKPSEIEEKGSSAIRSDRGLFFINPRNENKHKPQQIWTQGETENNSKWFPTIDKPNERCTQEMYITVNKKFTTLSNGLLINSVENNDGTRTDYWKQDLAHTPYLFMMAIGEFAVVQDKWKELDVNYYVEPEYKDHAKTIFNHTPEMMTFFSDVLDYPYPWEKYSQVVVRDFVSGAMENTTASVYGEFVQRTSQELIDQGNDNIVAHELFHHWFGDLVTCESWSNLTLNEGFANYSEYLWQEHKYGKDAAENHRTEEMKAYLESSINNTHPLIHYGYEDKEDMFDAHSYNKGGLVLHMLRNIVGDDAFFKSLNTYLTDNAFTAVEVDELRMAFEDTTGLDLQWFFDQWYMDSGHPVLDVDYDFDYQTKVLTVTVDQIQEEIDHNYIYQLPTDIAIYFKDGSVQLEPFFINNRTESFTIQLEEEPAVTVLDGNRYLLADIKEVFSTAQLKALYAMSPHYMDKKIALTRLRNNDRAKETFAKALTDPFHYFRKLGLAYKYLEVEATTLEKMAMQDVHSRIRKEALHLLKDKDIDLAFTTAQKLVSNELAIPVLSEAIKIIYAKDQTKGLKLAEELYKKYKNSMSITLLDIFSKGGNPDYLNYLNEAVVEADIYKFFPVSSYQYKLASQSPTANIVSAADALYSVSVNKDENSYKKYISTSNISKLIDVLKERLQDPDETSQDLTMAINKLDKMLSEIIQNEIDESLIEKYRTSFGT